MRKRIFILFLFLPLISSNSSTVSTIEPEIRLEKKLEHLNKELHYLEQLIKHSEKV